MTTGDAGGAAVPRRGGWGWAVGIGLAVLGLLLAAGYMFEEARREDTPDAFARLAANLCRTMTPPGVKEVRPSEAEAVVSLKHRLAVDADISRTGRVLASVADEDIAVIDQLQAVSDRHETAVPLVGAVALTAVGVFAQSGEATQVGGEHALDELRKVAQTWDEVSALRNRATANQIELALLAPQFSAPAAEKCFVTADFEEPGLVFGPDQHTLTLTNLGGMTLHVCLIDVRLTDRDGESFRSVRFVPIWQHGQALCTRFERWVFPETPDEVAAVSVTVWAREQSAPPLNLKRPLFGW